MIARRLAALIVLGSAALAVGVATPASADSILACKATVKTYSAKNITCGNAAQHWDSIKGGTIKWGSKARAGQWSYQSACWTNVTAYGMSA